MNTNLISFLQRPASALKNRSVVVFGGTSGIGLATAVQAKDAGANVIVIGFDPARTEQVATEYGFGWRVADVTNQAAVEKALADIDHVDHLVLMAGSFVAGKVVEAEVSYLRRAFDERVWASIDIIRALGNRLDTHASVTFISGVLADRPNAWGTSVLSAASAAMEAFARGLALEMAPRRFNTLSPGTTDTPLLARTLGAARDGYVNEISEKLPLKKIVSAQHAGAAIVFLMENEFMNAEVLHIDGGQRLV